MSAAIIDQLNEISASNGSALQDAEQRAIEFAGSALAPQQANAFIESMRADLQRLDVRPALAAIVEQLGGRT